MITVEEATEIIARSRKDFGTELVPLAKATGRILQEDWCTDRDLPPYDRVTMDGIAINYREFIKGRRSFSIEGTAAAGMERLTLQSELACLEVMTGSVCPLNTDVVIRYEDLSIENGVALIELDTLKQFQNIHFKGQDRKQGMEIVGVGTRISPAEIGVAASIGKSELLVSKLPKIMVISTGDELVAINETPLDHQIRRSNVYSLKAACESLGLETSISHLEDDVDQISEKLSIYLKEFDVLILSGGVSKGKFDYLPDVLSNLGVEKLFHKVKQRPGKPFWFGQTKDCTIFALPGNPISSFLCFEKYFKDWLHWSLFKAGPNEIYAELKEDVFFKPDLSYFLEVDIFQEVSGKLVATPQKGNGSGDLANLVRAKAFIQLARGKDVHLKGSIHRIYRYK